jgi:hypothetical protein
MGARPLRELLDTLQAGRQRSDELFDEIEARASTRRETARTTVEPARPLAVGKGDDDE